MFAVSSIVGVKKLSSEISGLFLWCVFRDCSISWSESTHEGPYSGLVVGCVLDSDWAFELSVLFDGEVVNVSSDDSRLYDLIDCWSFWINVREELDCWVGC